MFLQPVEATDDAFWDQFWADTTTTVQDVFALVPSAEIRAVREESPSNLATLCYKVRVWEADASVWRKLVHEVRLHRGAPCFEAAPWNNVAMDQDFVCQSPAQSVSLVLSDVGISESTPLPFPPLPVSWFQLPFEAAYLKQNRHAEVLTP